MNDDDLIEKLKAIACSAKKAQDAQDNLVRYEYIEEALQLALFLIYALESDREKGFPP